MAARFERGEGRIGAEIAFELLVPVSDDDRLKHQTPRDAVPLGVERWYYFREFGGYLGNIR